MEWGLILTVVGSLAAVLGIAALFSPGIATFLGEMFNFFTRTLFWVFDSMPKPIKVLMFIVLFLSMGAFMFDFTVGATNMCYEEGDADTFTDDVVYGVDLFDGIALTLWQTLKGEIISVQLVYDSDNVPSGNVTNSFNNTVNLGLNSTHAGIQSVAENGITYNVLYGIAPTTTIRTSVGAFISRDYGSLTELPPNEQWELLPNSEQDSQYKLYDICWDDRSDTCMLKESSEYSSCASNTGSSIGGFTFWNRDVGTILYRSEDMGEDIDGDGLLDTIISTRISPGVDRITIDDEIELLEGNIYGVLDDSELNWIQKSYAWLRALGDPDSGWSMQQASTFGFRNCAKPINELDMNITGMQDVVDMGFVYVKFNYQDVEFNGYIFNAEAYPLQVTRECEKTECLSVQGSSGRLMWDQSSEVVARMKSQVVNNGAERKEYSRKNIINVACNSETIDKPFDTVLLFMGINILDPKNMVFFIIFGAILSFFAYLAKFR